MFNKTRAYVRKNAAELSAGATALAVGMHANAAVDTSSITAALVDVGLAGTAVLSVYVGVKAFKWIRAAL
jgi:Bacteriophage coat protein B.